MHGRHGRGPGQGRGRGHGPGRGRAGHLLESALLCSLLRGPAHGYALIEDLVEFGLEGVSLRRIYRALQTMEDVGWVTSDWETERTQGPPRRVYALALGGARMLDEWVAELRESRTALDRLLDAYERRKG